LKRKKNPFDESHGISKLLNTSNNITAKLIIRKLTSHMVLFKCGCQRQRCSEVQICTHLLKVQPMRE